VPPVAGYSGLRFRRNNDTPTLNNFCFEGRQATVTAIISMWPPMFLQSACRLSSLIKIGIIGLLACPYRVVSKLFNRPIFLRQEIVDYGDAAVMKIFSWVIGAVKASTPNDIFDLIAA
jgi:hypothetical protein